MCLFRNYTKSYWTGIARGTRCVREMKVIVAQTYEGRCLNFRMEDAFHT